MSQRVTRGINGGICGISGLFVAFFLPFVALFRAKVATKTLILE